ncbi:MAG: MAC/perforin domain-containing protein [Anaerolineae bacterium]
MKSEVKYVETRFQMTARAAGGLRDIPGSECLGNGYDVVDGDYASPLSTTCQLFELGDKEKIQIDEEHTYNVPANVIHTPIRKGDFRVITGETIEEHQKNLSVEAGISGEYLGFKGSLDASFDMSTFRRSSFRYVTCMDIVKRWMLRLAAKPRDFLLPSVEKDINSMAPKDLFDTYGTHYLNQIIVGAKATYSSTISEIDYTSDLQLRIVAQASYENLVGKVDIKLKSELEESVSNFQSNSASQVRVFGGDPAYGLNICRGEYDKWNESTDERPVFMDFGPKGLQPIWKLCRDDDRKNQLKDALSGYAESKWIQTQRLPLQTGDLIALQADSGAYLSRIWLLKEETDLIAAAKWGIDQYSRFTVTVLHGGKIALQADTGKYLSRVGDSIEAAKLFEDRLAIDKFSKFTVEYLDEESDEETIALRADTGKYLNWVPTKRGMFDVPVPEMFGGQIVATKSEIDDSCKFSVEIL